MITRTFDETKWRLVPIECPTAALQILFDVFDKRPSAVWAELISAAPQPEPAETNSSDESALREAVAKILDRSYPKVARKIRAGMRSSNWSEDLVDPGFLFGALKSTPAAVRAENEACAKTVEEEFCGGDQSTDYEEGWNDCALDRAQAIRARMEGK